MLLLILCLHLITTLSTMLYTYWNGRGDGWLGAMYENILIGEELGVILMDDGIVYMYIFNGDL